EKFIGRTEEFLIERIEEGGRNIVVSRKALLARKQRELALETIKDLEVDKRYSAVITRVADFGAFADIGGLEGLIPRSELSYGHVGSPSDVVSTNDRVEVLVTSFEINEADPVKSRISLSLKKAKEDPYVLHWHKITVGNTLEGKVVRLEPFGAFVELFPGIDGLIHISELAENRVAHPKDVLAIGDPVSVRVLTVSESDKRIGLSLREAVSKQKGESKAQVKVERGQKASGVVSRIERYGVFLELDNGATALLPHSEIDLPKSSDLSRAFAIGQRLEVAVIDVDAQNRVRVSMIARKAMEERDSYLKFKTDEQARSGSFGSFADLIKKHKGQ
ncbi:MAG TPA: S1 RNA-binding domain-containing protein, partial [Myxococcota bacterium]|nr:S1 RNA-binding domain-containing protein [Myxococcota bacterium]